MNQFEKFKEKFNSIFDSIDTFIWEYFDKHQNILNLELKENNDNIEYDSYGSEDSKLERVFYSSEFDIYIIFKGTRASYEGEEWTEMVEVKPKEKTVTYYEVQ